MKRHSQKHFAASAAPSNKPVNARVEVRGNNIDQALRVLKRQMQKEGVFREMKQQARYEKPSEERNRKRRKAENRRRKLERKKAKAEALGLI
jgi:small subunit ribosomal protein S21